MKPKLACDWGSNTLGIKAGAERRSPVAEKTGSPEIWPPPVTLRAEGAGVGVGVGVGVVEAVKIELDYLMLTSAGS